MHEPQKRVFSGWGLGISEENFHVRKQTSFCVATPVQGVRRAVQGAVGLEDWGLSLPQDRGCADGCGGPFGPACGSGAKGLLYWVWKVVESESDGPHLACQCYRLGRENLQMTFRSRGGEGIPLVSKHQRTFQGNRS